jgi:hypothetical protein
MLLAGAWLLLDDLDGRPGPLLGALVRPALGTTILVASIVAIRGQLDYGESWLGGLLQLLLLVAWGILVYTAAIATTWIAAGRPDGAERDLMSMATSIRHKHVPGSVRG